MAKAIWLQGIRTVALVGFLSASLWLALFSSALAESIDAFVVDIEVLENGELNVTETITYDFGTLSRHGIYRNIKDKHAQEATAWYKDRYVDVQLTSVSRDGAPEQYLIQDYDGLSVRIGDANQTITGRHVYVIKYHVDGAISQIADGYELYWNVTGNEWEVPIDTASVYLLASAGVELKPAQYCYAGHPGASTACDDMRLGGQRASFKQLSLNPGQELTIAQAISLPIPPNVLERNDTWLLGLLLIVPTFLLGVVGVYRWRTYYKIDEPIIAQYEPYKNFKPMFTGILFDNRLDAKDLTAGIIYLAQQGFIKIKQTTDKVFWVIETTDYEIELLRSSSETETGLQYSILKMLFKNASDIGSKMKLSDIIKSPKKKQANYKSFQRMKKSAVKDLVSQGFLEQKLKRGLIPAFWFIAFLILVFSAEMNLAPFAYLVLGLFALLLIPLSFATERRTQQGYDALNHLKGFKEFLSVTEEERYKFHNAPNKNPDQFMEFLPYAIAFGVEKQWAEVFSDMTIPAPDWYSSNVAGAHFSATDFTTDLTSFSSAFSSSTGSSGSSGGGSAGGGGGGGGGGSW